LFNDEIQIYYCDDILAEYKEVLSRPSLKIAPEKITRFLKILKETGMSVESPSSSITMPDESDRVFYDTAKDNSAILITGNTKHYPLDDCIMTPRQYLERLIEFIALFGTINYDSDYDYKKARQRES